MALNLLSFNTMVSNSAAAVQSACSTLLDLTVGSVLRAILESSASVGLWMQWLILQVMAMTRAATSTGSDLDSWMADFGLTREAGTAATGSVTFSRYVDTAAVLIPVGTGLKTSDGTVTFTVTEDDTNALWNSGQSGYLVPSGTASATVPVQCSTVGTAGNVQIGTITSISSAIAMDTVTNGAAFTNGEAAETDAAFRIRFQAWISGLSRGTEAAISSAIADVQQGLVYTITENENPDGSTNDGFFFVVVDDGSGDPPSSLITSVSNAIESYRALGSRFAVYGPTEVTATITLSVTVASGYTASTVISAVQAAIVAMVNALGLGTSLPYYRIAASAFGASAGVENVSAITLNGGTADLAATSLEVIRTTTSNVTVSQA
ncbi:MAG: baseplate J/gp47 family protein [Acetobacteraceae bacterium]|nr:baseplate J/gp47 family protein [Acetobacteraceae bacterium]